MVWHLKAVRQDVNVNARFTAEQVLEFGIDLLYCFLKLTCPIHRWKFVLAFCNTDLQIFSICLNRSRMAMCYRLL